MVQTRSTDKETDDALRARLGIVLKRHSSAEVARRTGTSRANVSRYAQGTRMPMAFGTALTRELGVNPVWWLTGEGVPFLSDAPQGGKLAGEMLELVQSLNFVGQMRIGALGGKHHLGVLRELRDAMARYNDLRQRMNRHSAPILRKVLDDLRKALDDSNLELAEDLARTAEELGQLCEDPELARETATLHARVAETNLDLRGALELSRRVTTLALYSRGELGPAELEMIAQTVTSLGHLSRNEEARRTALAALALAGNEAEDSESAWRLRVQLASIQVQGGEIQSALPVLLDMSGRIGGQPGREADAILVRALLEGGNISVREAILMRGDTPDKAMAILGFAVIMEETSALKAAVDYVDRVHPAAPDSTQRWHAGVVLRILQGKPGDTAELAQELLDAGEVSELALDWRAVFAAQFFRLLGLRTEGRRAHHRACRNVNQLPEWYSFPISWQARHHRNALELGTQPQKEAAREFFARHVQLGYRAFEKLL